MGIDEKHADVGPSAPRSGRLITLSWQHWFAVTLTMFVLMIATFAAFHFFLDEFLWEHLLAARLEEQYGFKGGRVPVVLEDGETFEAYVLVDVVKGGPLDHAGFEIGDAPGGGFHSQSVSFLRRLDAACDTPEMKVSVTKVVQGREDPKSFRQLTLPCVE
jgi:hypothetical protein